jgi:hypothetical protein
VTLPAVDSWDVRGLEGPAYKVGPHCSNPNCKSIIEYAHQMHHIVRRSKLRGQPQSWIAIDGFVIGNLTGLCPHCHDDVTGVEGGHKAAIRWIQGEFWWCLVSFPDDPATPAYHAVAPIQPQPPTPDTLASRASDNHTSGPESCPFCGQRRRRSSLPPRVGRRRRKSWNILVPADELEQGADVLDSLVESLAPVIPNADASATGRYYVVVAALVHAITDSTRLVESLSGRGE